ncbi:methyltransferase domain-containing protein, partial [Myxococcota bacterium]|nr:methyltransferase domain-containing protein [Myxococcota bacterium]
VLQDRATPSRSFFDSVGGDWDQLRKVLKDDLLRAKAIEQLVPRNLTVADIGTGTGILAIQLLTLNAKVIAVDRSISMLEAARESLPTNALKRIDLRRGDASQLPIENNSVDAAFAHMVLHYLARPLDAVREMARITKPGGKVIIVDFISHNEEWMREELHMLWLGFDPKELKQMLKAAGLTDVNCTIQSETSDTPELPRTLIVSGIRSSTNQL